MKKQIMSESLKKLICAMSAPENCREDVMRLLAEYTPAIAEDLELTSMSYEVSVPATFGAVGSGMKGSGVMFDNGGSRAVEYKSRFETRNGGYLELIGTSAAEDPEQEDTFKTVCGLTFSLCGKINSVSDLLMLSVTDSLTGAMNMNGFRKTLAPQAGRGLLRGHASVFLNIKNFKYINQKTGMVNGDMILKELVVRFRELCGDNEGYIARLGADNFVLALKKEQVPELTAMLRSFRVELKGAEGDAEIKVYFRCGLYYMTDESTFEDLMNCCTCAYAAARGGKGDFVRYEPYMTEDEHHTKKVLVTFPEAIKSREFQVYYQPKVRCSDKKMVGAEALCRWVKDGRIIPPMDFIPILERFGNISHLDLYVVETVARDLREWLDKGITPVRTSLNISRRDLAITNLANKISEIVDKYEIPHELIEIELTETYTTEEFPMMLRLINELKGFGFRISIDDFGSGYSTLTMLKSIRADIIKLDRAFIKDMTESSSEDRIILKHVVHMVNELDIDVIAEGIETSDQVGFLNGIGCDVVQGYYYDKPLPRAEFDERLADPEWYAKRG